MEQSQGCTGPRLFLLFLPPAHPAPITHLMWLWQRTHIHGHAQVQAFTACHAHGQTSPRSHGHRQYIYSISRIHFHCVAATQNLENTISLIFLLSGWVIVFILISCVFVEWRRVFSPLWHRSRTSCCLIFERLRRKCAFLLCLKLLINPAVQTFCLPLLAVEVITQTLSLLSVLSNEGTLPTATVFPLSSCLFAWGCNPPTKHKVSLLSRTSETFLGHLQGFSAMGPLSQSAPPPQLWQTNHLWLT